MLKIILWIISSTILLAPWYSLNASHQMPFDAFWIENHWKNSNGFKEIKPVNWHYVIHDDLFLSGSAALTLGNMVWLNKTYGKKHSVFILDLRQETHIYTAGLPISLFYKRNEINWGKKPQEIKREEKEWIKYFLKRKLISINKLGRPEAGFKVPQDPEKMPIKNIYTEAEAVRKGGLGYFRIDVPDYHPPSPEQVDQFLKIIKQIPQNSWLHIHCAAGKGRTTTFMAMRDIVAHAQKDSLEDIISRQEQSGGINLLRVSSSHKSQPWKKEYHQARVIFIKLFYNYIHSEAYAHDTFNQWLKKQPENLYTLLLKSDAYVQK